MNTNNQNLNSSLTLFAPIKKLSIDTLDSSEQSTSQNLDKQTQNDNSKKKEKWQHNSSNITHSVSQNQDQSSFMINKPTNGTPVRKGSEEFTLSTQPNHQNSNQTQQIEEKESKIEIKTQIIKEQPKVDDISAEFSESIFMPDNLIQNNKEEKKKRISINFKQNKKKDTQTDNNNSGGRNLNELKSDLIKNYPQQEQNEFAESTILNQRQSEQFIVEIENRGQSESITYFNPYPQISNPRQSILHPIEENDRSGESQSLVESMMNSNKLSPGPGNIVDKKFYDSQGLSNFQQKFHKNTVDEFGSSTLIETKQSKINNQNEFQESLILQDMKGQAQQSKQKNSNLKNRESQQDQQQNKKLFQNYDNYTTPKHIQNAFAESIQLDSTFSYQQTNSKTDSSNKNIESSVSLPKQPSNLISQQTQSMVSTIQFQESTLLTPMKTEPNFNQFGDSILFQPTINNFQQPQQTKQQEFQDSVVFDISKKQTNNFQPDQFQDSVTFPIQSSFQPTNHKTKVPAQNQNNQKFQESVIMNQQSQLQQQQRKQVLQPQTNNKQNQKQQTVQQQNYVSEFQDSVIFQPMRPKQEFEESILMQSSSNNIQDQFAESTIVNNLQQNKQDQFAESTIVSNIQPVKKVQQNQFAESTLFNNLPPAKKVQDEFAESTIVNNIITPPSKKMQDQFAESTLFNDKPPTQNNQFQESTIMNPQLKQRGMSQFQESTLFSQPHNQLSKNPSSPNKQSFASDQNFRQSIVRNVHGEIDFNQSVIFNNQLLFSSKAQSQNQSENNSHIETAEATKVIKDEKDKASKVNQNNTPQTSDRQTLQIYNKRQKNSKSDEYIKLMNQLNSKTPQLCFNPFDMMPIKKQNGMKIQIKSPDGYYYYDHPITTDGATFGRNPENNTVSFPHEIMISSYHAEIYFENLSFYLKDKGSKLGTFVKRKEIDLFKDTQIQLASHEVFLTVLDLNEKNGKILIDLKKKSMKSIQYQYQMKEGQEIKFGRDKEKCDVKINHTSISSEHSKIVYVDKKFKMIDLGSLNGNWLRMSPKGEVSEPFLITPDFSFKISQIIPVNLTK